MFPYSSCHWLVCWVTRTCMRALWFSHACERIIRYWSHWSPRFCRSTMKIICAFWTWHNGPLVGFTQLIPFVPLLGRFFSSELSKHWLPIEVLRSYIWQTLSSFSCGASVQFECDSKNLKGPLRKSIMLLREKLTNAELVTPHPGTEPKMDLCS